MKKLILFYFFCIPLFISAQEIDFSKITAGVSIKYLIPQGDMGEYWKKTPGAGLLLGYKTAERFYVEGELYYGRFSSKSDGTDYPEIGFIGMSGGIKYNLHLANGLHLNLKAGLQNNMFIFSGPAAVEKYQENRNESEFGYFILPGLTVNIGSRLRIEMNLQFLSILSSPESINIITPGITIFFL